MLQLSQKSKYALTFLAFLAKQEPSVFLSIKKISSQTGLPYRFLSQIAVDLKHAKMVDSKEGKGGGYFLNKELTKISLKDMVEAVDGTVGLVECQTRNSCGNELYCHNKHKWDQVRDDIANVLNAYVINDLL